MNDCVANEFESKIDQITQHFASELKKIKTELQVSKETSHLNMIHFNGQMENVTSHFHGELEKVKTELESSKISLDQLQRENAWLKENLENASKNQLNITSKIENLAESSSQEFKKVKSELQSSKESFFAALNRRVGHVRTILRTRLDQLQSDNARLKEPIFFDYTLENHMTSTGFEIVKFDRPRAVSATKIYDRSTGKVTIEDDGVYFFYAHGYPYDRSDWLTLYIYVDDEKACVASKTDGTRAHMSCAFVRHLKRGQQIYVKKDKRLFGSRNPDTGFLGFKLQ